VGKRRQGRLTQSSEYNKMRPRKKIPEIRPKKKTVRPYWIRAGWELHQVNCGTVLASALEQTGDRDGCPGLLAPALLPSLLRFFRMRKIRLTLITGSRQGMAAPVRILFAKKARRVFVTARTREELPHTAEISRARRQERLRHAEFCRGESE